MQGNRIVTTNDERPWTEHQVLIRESTDPETGKVYRLEEEVEGEFRHVLTVPDAAADVDAASSRWDATLQWLQQWLPYEDFLHVETRADDLLIATRAEAAARMVHGALALERERQPVVLAVPAPDTETAGPQVSPPAPPAECPRCGLPAGAPLRPRVRAVIAGFAAAFVAGAGIGSAMRVRRRR